MTHNSMNENPIEGAENDPELAPLDKAQVRKKLYMLGIVVLLILVGLITLTVNLYEPPVVVEGCNPGDKFSQTSGLPCSGEVPKSCEEGEIFNRTTGDPCVGAEIPEATPGEEYQASLAEYAGKSILFDANCVATPKSLNTSTYTKVLIANNSQKILEIVAPEKNAILPPYRTTFTTLTSFGVFPVMCNGEATAVINVK